MPLTRLLFAPRGAGALRPLGWVGAAPTCAHTHTRRTGTSAGKREPRGRPFSGAWVTSRPSPREAEPAAPRGSETRSLVGSGGRVPAGSCWRGVAGRSPGTLSPPSLPLSPGLRAAGERRAAREAPKELVGRPSLPGEGEYKHLPGGEPGGEQSRPPLRFPNLCLTARSSPWSPGALPGAAGDREARSPFLCPHPKTQPSKPSRVRLRKKGTVKSLLVGGLKKKKSFDGCGPLLPCVRASSYPSPPSPDWAPWPV